MLTLTLLRHAKAVAHGYEDDFARELTSGGRGDAKRLGKYLAAKGLMPDFALVSSAARTRQTFELVAGKGKTPTPARLEDTLYNATAGQIRDLLRVLNASVKHVMIVAHNPGIMEAALLLAREGDLPDLDRLRNRFPPGALAMLSFDHEDWLDARASGGRLDLLLLPEDLASPN